MNSIIYTAVECHQNSRLHTRARVNYVLYLCLLINLLGSWCAVAPIRGLGTGAPQDSQNYINFIGFIDNLYTFTYQVLVHFSILVLNLIFWYIILILFHLITFFLLIYVIKMFAPKKCLPPKEFVNWRLGLCDHCVVKGVMFVELTYLLTEDACVHLHFFTE